MCPRRVSSRRHDRPGRRHGANRGGGGEVRCAPQRGSGHRPQAAGLPQAGGCATADIRSALFVHAAVPALMRRRSSKQREATMLGYWRNALVAIVVVGLAPSSGKAQPPVGNQPFDWSGFYVGGFVGGGAGDVPWGDREGFLGTAQTSGLLFGGAAG